MKKQEKNIILTGFMGSGKTTVGVRLSWRLKTLVEDTDKLIERREGMSIRNIFDTRGEAYFRERETELLQELCEKKYCRIISTGGGTPVRPENRPLLKRLGTVVYLRLRPETVYDRIKGDTGRPLLQCENPLERIRKLLAEREAAYEECADIVLDVDDMSVEGIAEEIIVRQNGGGQNSSCGTPDIY